MITSTDYTDKELEKYLRVDGSLRDMHVDGTTLTDWNKLIRTLRESEYRMTYYVGQEIQEFPDSFENQFTDNSEAYRLSVQYENVIFNTYFMTPDKVEFDLDPRDFVAFEQNGILYRFMRLLADTLDKKVTLTPENSEEISLFEIRPNDNRILRCGIEKRHTTQCMCHCGV